MFKLAAKSGKGNKSGSPNIPNLRTFIELIYALRNNKLLFQIHKLSPHLP